MFSLSTIQNILFLDIETVPQTPDFAYLDDSWKKLWELKSNSLRKADEDTPETLYQRAGIYAEFGKIICISCGFFRYEGGEIKFRVKSFYGDDEKILLQEFSELLNNYFNKPDSILCAHNGKEFDFPFLCRRLIINYLPIPEILNIAGKKPWEVKHLDTMELWKFGDYKSYTTLNLLAHTLNVPTPKDDIDGSMVRDVYYTENNLQRIAVYCQKDVITTAQIILRYSGLNILKEDQIILS
ncbi:MAG: 3'-5' exonuclease [Bacteroidia bacterium]|nr:3'-5' exonuclease [Bacteroidia bacterium]